MCLWCASVHAQEGYKGLFWTWKNEHWQHRRDRGEDQDRHGFAAMAFCFSEFEEPASRPSVETALAPCSWEAWVWRPLWSRLRKFLLGKCWSSRNLAWHYSWRVHPFCIILPWFATSYVFRIGMLATGATTRATSAAATATTTTNKNSSNNNKNKNKNKNNNNNSNSNSNSNSNNSSNSNSNSNHRNNNNNNNNQTRHKTLFAVGWHSGDLGGAFKNKSSLSVTLRAMLLILINHFLSGLATGIRASASWVIWMRYIQPSSLAPPWDRRHRPRTDDASFKQFLALVMKANLDADNDDESQLNKLLWLLVLWFFQFNEHLQNMNVDRQKGCLYHH